MTGNQKERNGEEEKRDKERKGLKKNGKGNERQKVRKEFWRRNKREK